MKNLKLTAGIRTSPAGARVQSTPLFYGVTFLHGTFKDVKYPFPAKVKEFVKEFCNAEYSGARHAETGGPGCAAQKDMVWDPSH